MRRAVAIRQSLLGWAQRRLGSTKSSGRRGETLVCGTSREASFCETRPTLREYRSSDNRLAPHCIAGSVPIMPALRPLLGGLLGLVLCVSPLRAEKPPSPLRLVPAEADLVLQTKSPRQLIEAITTLDYVKNLQ